ncbi:MAG: S8 family serine peptidase [Deltaproteobacteria bacterium]|nr:S8 family serine peptidase [Deltaproteobacteria bacterium]
MMLLLAAMLSASYLPPAYYSTHGKVTLEEDTNAVAFRVSSRALLSRLEAKHPDVTFTHMFGDLWLVGHATDPAALRSDARALAAATLLPVYHPQGETSVYIADEKIRAQFDKTLSAAEVNRRVKAAGGVAARVLRPELGLYEVLCASPRATVAAALRLQESRAARFAHPDFIIRLRPLYIPNDPLFADQWHHENIGSQGAFELIRGAAGVAIAIIDSGTDMLHPDLAGKIVSPRDLIDNDDDPTPDPTDAHGTNTAGIAAATGDNEIGIAGVCPDCSLMPLRIMSESGFSRMGIDSDAFYWASDHGAQVLSNSWGPEGAAGVPSDLDLAIHTVAETGRDGAGSVILFAAGNDGRMNESYELASHPLVLGIGASNYFDLREDYSNWGAELDLTAPAAAVSTDIRGQNGYAAGDYFMQFSGTSAATPVAAGVAALVYSVNLSLSRAQVQSILFETADKVGSVTYDAHGFEAHYGYGRVNAMRAVQQAAGGDVCQPVPELCDDGADNDCDWLSDSADPSCAPTVTPVGVICTQDFQCGIGGLCFGETMGFTGGYCSTTCTDACPGNATCFSTGNGGYCLASCASIADCRAGYDCLSPDGQPPVCLPSCTVNGCNPGETCDPKSGECVHDGPNGPGAACTADVQCAKNGWCIDWMPDGYCVIDCYAAADCAAGSHCVPLGRFDACLPQCERRSDCRPGYSCWPEADGTGSCWAQCESADDCNGDVCNEWGLCGTDTPPKTDPPPSAATDPNAGVCACDETYSCDKDCACDPECNGKSRWSCTATPPSLIGALLALAGIGRRRRIRR